MSWTSDDCGLTDFELHVQVRIAWELSLTARKESHGGRPGDDGYRKDVDVVGVINDMREGWVLRIHDTVAVIEYSGRNPLGIIAIYPSQHLAN